MKIVEVINALGSRGGAEVFFHNLCKTLAKKPNVELTIIQMFDARDTSFNDLLELKGVKLYTCHKSKKIDFSAAKELKKILDEVKPDIVNTHLRFYPTFFLAYRFKKLNFRLVHTIHSEREDQANLLKKRYLRQKKLSLIGIAPAITDLNAEKFDTDRIATIENGIVFPSDTTPKEHKYEFICVAGFREVKNHRMLLEAFQKHLQKHPSHKLACVGGGELFENTKQYAEELGIIDNVDFLGWQNDVSPFLRESSFSILSSHWEGNPISTLESLSYGVPAILPAVGGIPNIIKEGLNGYLYPRDDKQALIETMEKAVSLPPLDREKIIEDARQYDIEITADKYLEYFEKIMKEN